MVHPQLLVTLYNAANFLILPTKYEGFPLAPLEAMACGLSIIISKECPTKEIIQDGVEGFIVDQRKPEFYAEKILKLQDHFQDETFSLNCRKLAEKYSWEQAGQQYLNLYEKMIN